VFPDQDWAESKASFGRPVLPPNFDPSASPTRTFTINCSWIPFIRGALLQLVEQATWKTDDPDVLTLAQMRAMTLISLFDECSSLVLPFSCDFDIESSSDGSPFVCADNSATDPVCSSVFTGGSGFTDELLAVPSSGAKFRWAQCKTTFSSRHITFVVMGYDLVKGLFSSTIAGTVVIVGYLSGSVVFAQYISNVVANDGSGLSFAWSGDQVVDEIFLNVTCGFDSGGGDPGGAAAIRTCRIDGYGAASLCGGE